MEGALVNYISYKYTEDFSADDLFWMYGTQEYMDYAKKMKEWADKGFWSSAVYSYGCKEALLTEQALHIHRILVLWSGSIRYRTNHQGGNRVMISSDAHRFFSTYTGDGVADTNSQNQAGFYGADLDLIFDPDILSYSSWY